MPKFSAYFICLTGVFFLSACTSGPSPTISGDRQSFHLRIDNRAAGEELLRDSSLYAAGARVTVVEIAGRTALRMATVEEFSDLYFDWQRMLGHPVDMRSGFLSFDLYVPEGSDVASIKFNQLGPDGSFGGCGNYFNQLSGNRGRWLSVVVPLEEQQAECQRWAGDGDYREEVVALSLNPYNANRVDSAVLYVNNLRLSQERPSGNFVKHRLAKRPYVARNSPYTITFEDATLLARQLAYRTFEATTQYLASGVYGNPGRAIRAYGTGANRYICFLPDIEEMTGHPVDFHQLDSLYFRYYLTEESDTVDGARLFITTGKDWEGILIAEDFLPANRLERGRWARYAAAIDDLTLTAAREPLDVLAAVYELRLDLKYDTTAGPIEFWVDDLGWK